MSEEEKAAALELQNKLDQDSKIKKLGDTIESIQEMMKSIQDQTTKKEEVADDVEEIDFSTIDAVEMAKSMAENPEGQKDWLNRFISASVVNIEDLIDEETGDQLFSEELRKSLEESESQGASVLNLILQTMDTNNERMAKRDEMLLAGMSQMSKSFSITAKELVEMKKSIRSTTIENVDPAMPELEGNSQLPASIENGGAQSIESGFDKNLMFSSLTKSFKTGMPREIQEDFYTFSDLLNNGASYEDLISEMTHEQQTVFTSNLEV